MSFRITADVGGTFTDVVVADNLGRLTIGKTPTQVRAVDGVLTSVAIAAGELAMPVSDLLAATDLFTYATTRSTNAIVEGTVAKTALLVTQGFPDILVLREGGRKDAFDRRVPYPEPYIPRRLTFEIQERVTSEGSVACPLDEKLTVETLLGLREIGIQSIAVCFLWSIANSAHELRVGELIEEMLPEVSFTLSHALSPMLREFRRASATAIDASLKPLMGPHFDEVAQGLREAGFGGELMVATSKGGVLSALEVSKRPIDTVKSGPSMAPIGGLAYSAAEKISRDVIVCDTGGTTFDVSLARDGAVSYTRETWLGPQFTGHLIGSTSVDVRSIGSGGGSIAWVDAGGLLRVGPMSAGADPGPAAYGRGGDRATVTDAAVVLGWLNPEAFLGGKLKLDVQAARRVINTLAEAIDMSVEGTAEAVVKVANEHMVTAIQDITVRDGVDPREAVLVAGGGAAGLSVVSIARELGLNDVLVPRTAGALSAAGAQFSDIVFEFAANAFADSAFFDEAAINAVLADLDRQAEGRAAELRRRGVEKVSIERYVDARYSHQVWDIEIPLPVARIEGKQSLAAISSAFDEAHERIFAVSEPGGRIECLAWKLRLRAGIGQKPRQNDESGSTGPGAPVSSPARPAYIDGAWREIAVLRGASMAIGELVEGPAIVEEATSTLVIPAGATARLTPADSIRLEVGDENTS